MAPLKCFVNVANLLSSSNKLDSRNISIMVIKLDNNNIYIWLKNEKEIKEDSMLVNSSNRI